MTIQKVKRNLEKLLDEYDYEYSDYALNLIVDEWYNQKDALRNLFRMHPNWNEEEQMIAFDIDMNREIDKNAILKFRDWAINSINSLDGTFGVRHDMWYSDKFPCQQFVTEEMINLIQMSYPDFKAAVGQKTSRAMNKLFVTLGIDKCSDYNREFAKYADALNPLKITRHTVISINLIDYLTMSFGNSWASCHTIDKCNKRGMPNNYSGCYSSGTLSYALDETSIVFYTVDSKYNGNEYYFEPKMNRQMFHFGEYKLVQGRLYPQACDSGSMDIYTQFRNLMQEVVTQCLGVPNLWKLERGTNACCEAIRSYGTHYRDYSNFSNCNVSILKSFENENKIEVGAEPICIECGERHDTENNINCCQDRMYCACCEDEIDEENSYYVNGEYYCRDCVTYCECCGEYVLNDDATYIESEDRYICESCRNEYYEYCEHCGEYYYRDDMIHIDYEDEYVCSDCLDDNYCYCDNCQEYFRYEDMHEVGNNYYCDDCYEELKENEEEDDYEDEAI